MQGTATLCDMPAKKAEEAKVAISLTLSERNLKGLRDLIDQMEFKPSVSQLVDRAVTEFLSARTTTPRAKGKGS